MNFLLARSEKQESKNGDFHVGAPLDDFRESELTPDVIPGYRIAEDCRFPLVNNQEILASDEWIPLREIDVCDEEGNTLDARAEIDMRTSGGADA